MNFTNKNLSVIAYANGFTLWHYKTHEHTRDAVSAQDYFSDAEMTSGDMIMVSGSSGSYMLCVAVHGAQIFTAAVR